MEDNRTSYEKWDAIDFPVGVRCTRLEIACASRQHDRKCYGPACPFNGFHPSAKERNGKKSEVNDEDFAVPI